MTCYELEFVVPASEPMYDADYEPHLFRELMKRMRPGVTFLDVGANIGLFAIHAAKRGASVIAIEPKPGNTNLLLENARKNEVSVELHPLGASAKAGYAVLEICGNINAGMHHLAPARLADTVIATQRIDAIVEDRQIDVIKIDIEGHEYHAMLGAQKTLARCRPAIFTEYSSDFQRIGSGVDGLTYLNLLLEHSYRIFILRSNGPESIEPAQVDAEWQKAPTHVDLLLEPL